MTVAIVDYGSGNLHSVAKSFERAVHDNKLSTTIVVTSDPDTVRNATRIVLPGVGSFNDCRDGLKKVAGMWETLDEQVRRRGKPFLGICVGLQLMADRGVEYGTSEGFGWIPGEVKRIEPGDPSLKIPHMGWNTLDIARPHPLVANLQLGEDGYHAYFVHSYHLAAQDRADVIATTNYGRPITALAGRDNFAGTQFHPEKSQALGLRLIANFLNWHP